MAAWRGYHLALERAMIRFAFAFACCLWFEVDVFIG
jgi:hypothetical protein